jgi:hypothetical protein
MSKFTPTKRAAAGPRELTVAKARGALSTLAASSDLAPKAKAKAPSKPANAPIVMAVDKYTSEAKDVVNAFRPDEPLWCLRVGHDAWPNVESSAIAATNAFLADLNAGDAGMPRNLQELRLYEQVILQIGRWDATNVDGLPLQEFSLMYYVGGTTAALRNAIHLLVEFFYHRCTHPIVAVDKKPWPVPADIAVHIHPRLGINLDGLDTDITRMTVTLQPPALVLPLSLWATNPPGSCHALMVEIEGVDKDSAIFGWDGRTYGFCARFEQALIPRLEDNLRVLPDDMRDFALDVNRQRILDIFGNLVLRDLVCCVRVTGEALQEDGPVAELVAQLKTMPSLFFDAF